MSTAPRRLVDDPDAPALARVDLGIAANDPTFALDVAAGLERLRARIEGGGGGSTGSGGTGAGSLGRGALAGGPALWALGGVLVAGAVGAALFVTAREAPAGSASHDIATPAPTPTTASSVAAPTPTTAAGIPATTPTASAARVGVPLPPSTSGRKGEAVRAASVAEPARHGSATAPAPTPARTVAPRTETHTTAPPAVMRTPQPAPSVVAARAGARQPAVTETPAAATKSTTPPTATRSLGPREEIAQLAEARNALAAGDSGRALRLAEDGHAMFPRGLLYEEREAIAIEALADLGLKDEARSRGARYLARFPNGPQSERVRRAIGK